MIAAQNIKRGNQVAVIYAATGGGSCSLLINGVAVAQEPFVNTGAPNVYTEAVFDLGVSNRAEVAVLLDPGSIIMWVDKIEVNR